MGSKHHVARVWQAAWFRERDLILALDGDHYAWLRDAAPDAHAMNKVGMLGSFDRAVAGIDLLDQGIEDPWYGAHADLTPPGSGSAAPCQASARMSARSSARRRRYSS